MPKLSASHKFTIFTSYKMNQLKVKNTDKTLC